MRFCLSDRQEIAYLRQADEIKVRAADYKGLNYLAELYPDQDLILDIHEGDEVDFTLFTEDTKNKLTCRVATTAQLAKVLENGIKGMWGYPITSYEDLSYWINLGVSQVSLGTPLFFDLPRVKEFIGELPIRAVANIADYDEPLTSCWIRPEDIPVYEPFVSTIEFEDCNMTKEKELFKIYKKQNWPGKISILITNFTEPGLNRLIDQGFGSHRTRCRHKCEGLHSKCRFCSICLDLAQPELYKEDKNDNS